MGCHRNPALLSRSASGRAGTAPCPSPAAGLRLAPRDGAGVLGGAAGAPGLGTRLLGRLLPWFGVVGLGFPPTQGAVPQAARAPAALPERGPSLALGARGKLTPLPLVFQETGAAEQRGCERPGAAAVPPPHGPADHEGECAGSAGLWARGPAAVPVLETEAGEERHFQRSGCTDPGCSRGSRSRWFLEFSLQRVQAPAAGRACRRAPSCAAARVTQSQAAMPSRAQSTSAVILLTAPPGTAAGGCSPARGRRCVPGGVRPTARACRGPLGRCLPPRWRQQVAGRGASPPLRPCQAAPAGLCPSAVFPNPAGEGHEQPGRTWKPVLLEARRALRLPVILFKQPRASGEPCTQQGDAESRGGGLGQSFGMNSAGKVNLRCGNEWENGIKCNMGSPQVASVGAIRGVCAVPELPDTGNGSSTPRVAAEHSIRCQPGNRSFSWGR